MFIQWQKNVHKYCEIEHEVGTGILEFEKITGWVSEPGADRTGLGRWWWINIKGNNGDILRIVCDYQHYG